MFSLACWKFKEPPLFVWRQRSTCWNLRVQRTFWPFTYNTSNAHHVFRANIYCAIYYTLHDSGVVANIEKGQVLTVFTAS
jgi:hypothetical protein